MRPPDDDGRVVTPSERSSAVVSSNRKIEWNNGERVSLLTDAAPATFDSFSTDERNVISAAARGKSVADIARQCGCSQTHVRTVLRKTSGRVVELMDEIGLTDVALLEKYLKPALEATTVEYFAHRGEVTDSRKQPAWSTRLSALDTAARMRGMLAADKSNAHQTNVGVQVQVNQAIGAAKADTDDEVRP